MAQQMGRHDTRCALPRQIAGWHTAGTVMIVGWVDIATSRKGHGGEQSGQNHECAHGAVSVRSVSVVSRPSGFRPYSVPDAAISLVFPYHCVAMGRDGA